MPKSRNRKMKRRKHYETEFSKKLTAGILTGALAISVTACGGNSADTNNASTNADVSAETENSGDVTVINAVTGGSPKPYISVEEDGSYSGYDIEVLQAVFDRLPQYSLNLRTAEFVRFSQDLPLVIIRLLSTISATTRRERKVTTILSHMTRSNMYLFREQMMNHSLLYKMPLTEVTRLRQVPE